MKVICGYLLVHSGFQCFFFLYTYIVNISSRSAWQWLLVKGPFNRVTLSPLRKMCSSAPLFFYVRLKNGVKLTPFSLLVMENITVEIRLLSTIGEKNVNFDGFLFNMDLNRSRTRSFLLNVMHFLSSLHHSNCAVLSQLRP